MGKARVRFAALAMLVGGCEGRAEEGVAEEAAAVTISNDAGIFSIESPPGEYNGFSLDASCSHADGNGSYGVWTRAGYAIPTNLDCLDCFLPETVVIGQAVSDHVLAACLPSDAHESCEHESDASGLVMADLLVPAVLENGEEVAVSGISVIFTRVYEVWDDGLADQYGSTIPFPRVDSATATLSVSSSGVVSVGSDWSICEDALNSPECFL